MKKWGCVITAIFFACSCLFSQDLVEAAKKEKERRAKLKKKSSVVVTNADLVKTGAAEIQGIPSPENKTQNIPGKKQPSRQTNASQIEVRVDRTSQKSQLQARGLRNDYATQVLSSNEIVKNPAFALNRPDGKFAEIPLLGFIDLQISAKNGPGDDIAIYALHAGAQAVRSGGEEEGGIPQIVADFYGEGLWYGVLGMEEGGDWVAIGKGSGTASPEKFDLGDLPSVSQIRIMFRQFSNADFPVKLNRAQANDSVFKIDAIESLHR